MKMIIVAAGQGTRLRPLTNDKPKCMVEYQNKPIIDYILDTAERCNVNDIAVVNGYKKDVLETYLKNKDLTFYTNKNYYQTNMVSSLFCSKEFMNDDLIISYADIIYEKEVLDQLLSSKSDFSVIVDKEWMKLWSIRMENPLEDAETLKVHDDKIVEIGKKATNYSDIEGQYIGLIRISKSILNRVIDFYDKLDRFALYDGQTFDNMYMTTFIQLIINNLLDVTPIFINGRWLEIDTIEDLLAYNKANLLLNK